MGIICQEGILVMEMSMRKQQEVKRKMIRLKKWKDTKIFWMEMNGVKRATEKK